MEISSIKKQVDQLIKILESSPIRKRIKNNVALPIDLGEDKIKVIDDLYDELMIQEEKINKPLNIVVMGEIKSGKSTLINALVKDDISPTDVLEATALIYEIGYGSEEKAVVHFRDGSEKEGSIKNIFEYLRENQNDVEFALKVDKVKITKNNPSYKYYNLVDTPGLLTITEKNINTTKDYIKWSDVILWVLDANYLGQSDVIEEIEEVEQYGKPIIGILNKIDLVGDDIEKVIEYANDEYDLYFEKIIPISARESYLAMINDDEELKNESGIKKLTDYLSENISASPEKYAELKFDSMERTIKSIAARDRYYHADVLNGIEEIIEMYYNVKEHMDYHCERINKKVKDVIKLKVNREFLEKEYEQIESLIDRANKKELETLEIKISNMVSEKSLKEYVVNVLNEINTIIKDEWNDVFQLLQIKIKDNVAKLENNSLMLRTEFKEYMNGEYQREFGQDISDSDLDDLSGVIGNSIGGDSLGINLSDLAEGVFISGEIGALFAAYEAVLGPAAASVTIESALSTIMPYAAVLGVVAGLLKSSAEVKRRKGELKVSLRDMILQAKDVFNNELVDVYIMPKVEMENERFKENSLDEYIRIVFNNSDILDVEKLKDELEDYINLMESNDLF